MLRNNTIPTTLHDKLLTFRDRGKVFEFKENLLKMITIKNYNVDLPCLVDEKTLYDFAEDMHSDVKSIGNKSTRDRTLGKLLKSPANMASGLSTIFLPANADELCERLKLLLEERQAGNNCDLINEKMIAIIDKLLKYKCVSQKQHKQTLIKCSLLHE